MVDCSLIPKMNLIPPKKFDPVDGAEKQKVKYSPSKTIGN